MTSDCLLEVRGLTKDYYGLTAVDQLDLCIQKGSVTGMIGPNGSGKSTTIDCISGFQHANAGRWFLAGKELTGLAAHQHAMAGLTRTFQAVRAYEELSLLDNLRMACQEHDGIGWLEALRGGRRERETEAATTQRAHGLLDAVGLEEYGEAPAEILSYGQSKLLAIAAAMMSRPVIVVLDEPVAGVNPSMINRIEAVIRQLNREGVTFIIVEHNVDFVMKLSHHVIVLEQGRKIAEGDPGLIRSDPRVLDAYLGVDAAGGREAVDG